MQFKFIIDGYAYLDQFVKDNTISTNKNDIAAIRLYKLAMKQENPTMRSELLKSASEMNSMG